MWQIIPQVFYDLLARAVPGALLLFGAASVAAGPTAAARFVVQPPAGCEPFGLGGVLLWALGSYATGIVIGQFWEYAFGWHTRRLQKRFEEEVRPKCLAEHNALQIALGKTPVSVKPSDLPRTFVMRDHLRYLAPAEGLRLLKVRAERRGAEVLLLGLGLLAATNGVWLALDRTAERLVLEIVLLAGVAAFFRMARRLRKMLITGTVVSFLQAV